MPARPPSSGDPMIAAEVERWQERRRRGRDARPEHSLAQAGDQARGSAPPGPGRRAWVVIVVGGMLLVLLEFAAVALVLNSYIDPYLLWPTAIAIATAVMGRIVGVHGVGAWISAFMMLGPLRSSSLSSWASHS